MHTGMHCLLWFAYNRLLAGRKCEVRRALNGMLCNGATKPFRAYGWKSGRRVHGCTAGIKNNRGMKEQVH